LEVLLKNGLVGIAAAVAGPLITLGLNFERFERWWTPNTGNQRPLIQKVVRRQVISRHDRNGEAIELERGV